MVAPGCRPDEPWETPCSPGSSSGRREAQEQHRRPDAQVNLPEILLVPNIGIHPYIEYAGMNYVM